ncbi:MAG: ribosome maturation factor RimP [Spirochaetia bacterium]
MSDRESELKIDFAPLLRELGFQIVELHAATVKGRVHLDLVIYGADGVAIDDCAAVYKVIMPRAELMLDSRDVALQVASPGTDRTFKDNGEFAVFVDRGVRVLVSGADDWIGGVVDSVSESDVTLRDGQGRQSIAFADIQKVRLDYSQEVKRDHGR